MDHSSLIPPSPRLPTSFAPNRDLSILAIPKVLTKARQFSIIHIETLPTCSTITYFSNGLHSIDIVHAVVELWPINSKSAEMTHPYNS